jgi:uncharacterized membrane protein YqiK
MLTKIATRILGLSILSLGLAQAQPLPDFTFKSPSFNANGYSAHILTIENQEHSRRDNAKKEIEAALEKEKNEAEKRADEQEKKARDEKEAAEEKAKAAKEKAEKEKDAKEDAERKAEKEADEKKEAERLKKQKLQNAKIANLKNSAQQREYDQQKYNAIVSRAHSRQENELTLGGKKSGKKQLTTSSKTTKPKTKPKK